jgi:hypothetical protein
VAAAVQLATTSPTDHPELSNCNKEIEMELYQLLIRVLCGGGSAGGDD